MRKLSFVFALALAAMSFGCAADDPDLIDSGEADDRALPKDFNAVMDSEVEITAKEHRGEFEVKKDGERVTVNGPIYRLAVPEKGELIFSIHEGYDYSDCLMQGDYACLAQVDFDAVTDSVEFQLMTMESGDWKEKKLVLERRVNGVKTLTKVSRFESITYDTETDKLKAVVRINDELINFDPSEYNPDFAARLKGVAPFGILPIPYDTAGSDGLGIEGSYKYTVYATCGGVACGNQF